MTPRQFVTVMKKALAAWSDDYAPSMGAAISYYTLFSITPLLVIVIAIAGFFFGDEAVRGEIFVQLNGLIGAEGARTVEQMLQSVAKPEEELIAALVSFGVLALGATTVLNELQNDLDRIWRVPTLQKSAGLAGFARSRLLSLALILTIAFLLIVSLVFSAAISAIGKWWGAWFGGWELLAHVIDLFASFGFMTLLFAIIYKIVPSAHIRWHDVWVGAAVTAMLFAIGKVLIGLYLGRSGIASGFGAAGSLVLLMVWVYYSAQIFLIGAEFTWVYAHELGSRSDKAHDAAIPDASAGEGA
ncbi:MAG TPA: YihY/virulence factor BrkB family protein [Burkholderiales bacterium]|nr:YihY/virulence factor BrkB family protein [Burkholderiales bacterium]